MTTDCKDQQVTRLLQAWQEGDRLAGDKLIPLVYMELKKIASSYLKREREDHTFQTTDLVNEAFLRLVDQTDIRWQDRVHFFGFAARIMRQILIEYLRKRLAKKRGGAQEPMALNDGIALVDQRSLDLLKLDDALTEFERFDARKSRLVELRYFAGLTIEETAEVLGISPATVKREWVLAKAWLYSQMTGKK